MAEKDEMACLEKFNRNFPVIECTLESTNEEKEIRQIMLDKLKEMAEVSFRDCMDGYDYYANVCGVMNDIAKTLLDK